MSGTASWLLTIPSPLAHAFQSHYGGLLMVRPCFQRSESRSSCRRVWCCAVTLSCELSWGQGGILALKNSMCGWVRVSDGKRSNAWCGNVVTACTLGNWAKDIVAVVLLYTHLPESSASFWSPLRRSQKTDICATISVSGFVLVRGITLLCPHQTLKLT